jgi:hypothetical protein
MKNKISFFICVFAFAFFINLISFTNSEAELCKTNADGAIILSTNGVAGTQPAGDVRKLPFNFKNNNAIAGQCNAEPDQYKITFYKLALCTENPYRQGGPVFDSCVDIMNNTSGKEIIIRKGVENNDLLDGADLLLPTGTYPYLTAVVGNHLHVKHIQEFVQENGDPAKMWGNGDTTAANRRYCYTVGVVTTITGGRHTTQASYATAHGDVDIVTSGSGASARLKCTDNKVTAEANNTFATEIIDHFGENGDLAVDNWIPYLNVGDIGNGEVSSTDVEMAANMLEADNETIATTFNTAKRIGVYIKYPNSVKISESTVGFKINIGTTHGISLDSAQVVEGEVVKTWMAKVGVDPFTIVVQTKTKRRRGAWR